MSFSVKKSTQFKINELVVVSKAGPIDISSIYEEISIFDSVFMPVMSGHIMVRDAVGLSSSLIFDGSETILIDISKSEQDPDIANFRKSFRIYKQSDRVNSGLNSEFFTLHFCSDEMIYSNQQRVNQSYEGTYSKVVEKILADYLKIPENQSGGFFEQTSGVRKIVIPNLKPIEAIEWVTKRSLDQKQSPNYLFYQNSTGYNFVSLSKLLTQPELLDIRFELKNQTQVNPIEEISSARALEVISQTDMLEKIKSGVNAGQFIGFDPVTRTTAKKNIGFGDMFYKMEHGSQTPNQSVFENRGGVKSTEAFNSKISMASFNLAKQLSNYIKKNDPTSLSKEESIENWLFQRTAIMAHLMNKRVKIAMPGNFQLTSGFNINLIAPNFARKEKGEDNEDTSVSGKYMIVASRQIIKYDKHETIIEVASTTTNNEFVTVSNPQQLTQLLNY
jgi:hypothetical protein